jgi:hypothetical protein
MIVKRQPLVLLLLAPWMFGIGVIASIPALKIVNLVLSGVMLGAAIVMVAVDSFGRTVSESEKS